MRAWHFCRNDKTLGYGDGREIKVGETISVEGKPVLCQHGLHGSVSVLDALQYASGSILCVVEIERDVQDGTDKVVGGERTTLAMADVTETLQVFARQAALRVVHLWDCSDVVREFLETGNPEVAAEAAEAAEAARAASAANAANAASAAEAVSAAEAAWAARAAARAASAAEAALVAALAAAWAAEAAWAAVERTTQEQLLLVLLRERHPELFEV